MALEKPIILTGMMGSGKSAVGRRLAKKLKLPFIDLDDEIVRAEKASIPEIFAKQGEAEFRRIEKEALKEVLKRGRAVIATGGGAVLDETTRALLKTEATTLWLKADIATLAKRVGADANRPLLKGDAPEVALQRLLEQREKFYAEAAITIENTTTPEAAVEEILRALKG